MVNVTQGHHIQLLSHGKAVGQEVGQEVGAQTPDAQAKRFHTLLILIQTKHWQQDYQQQQHNIFDHQTSQITPVATTLVITSKSPPTPSTPSPPSLSDPPLPCIDSKEFHF